MSSEPSRNAVDDFLHGLKRPHDGESTGEPSPKRDKLGEELEQMMADAKKVDEPAESNHTAHETSVNHANGGPAVTSATMRRVLPMRHVRRPSTQTAVKDGDQQGGSSAQNSSTGGSSAPRTPRDPKPK